MNLINSGGAPYLPKDSMNGKGRCKETALVFKGESNLPFAFAGIWEKRIDKNESTRLTFAIITREATGSVSRIHKRTPVILDRKANGNWLNSDEKDPKRLRKIIQEGAVVAISGHPVSKRVNSISNNDPSCIEPADNNN